MSGVNKIMETPVSQFNSTTYCSLLHEEKNLFSVCVYVPLLVFSARLPVWKHP